MARIGSTQGESRHAAGFRILQVHGLGWGRPWVVVAAAVSVFATMVTSRAAGDPFEPDDTSATARRLVVSHPAEFHTFEKVADQDWLYFYAKSGLPYSIKATTLSATCDVHLTLFGSDARTTVGVADWEAAGGSEVLSFLPDITGFYYVRARHDPPSAFGPQVSYWVDVTEDTGAGIPVETVDDRRVGIRPAPPGARPAAMAILTPGPDPRCEYQLHRVEFPGYEITTTGTAIDVTIRRIKDETERYGLPGQVFPTRGNALFVIETVRWTGSTSAPMAFSDPVNLVIQFAPYEAPTAGWNDVVTFRDEDATMPRMRAVRDMAEGLAIDFQFISGPQQADLVSRTVQLLGYQNLTGISGCATYGAVAEVQAHVRDWPSYH